MNRPLLARFHFLLVLTLLPFPAWSARDINLITWWGYVSPETVAPIEKACGARVSIDEYYSSPEFLRRSQGKKYDIAILSHAVLQKYRSLNHGANISFGPDIANRYPPQIAALYSKGNYPSNMSIFQLSLTGFLWNPKNISIKETDTIDAIFKKAKGKTIVVLDEHIEVMNLLSKTQVGTGGDVIVSPPIAGVKRILEGSNIVVSPNLGDLVSKEDFAFAFAWSGESHEKISGSKVPLQFMVHPMLSHWSADLLALQSGSKEALCVATHLSGGEYLDELVKSSFYFSPYGHFDQHPSALYRDMASGFLRSIGSIQRLPVVSSSEYDRLDSEWQDFKLKFFTTLK